MRRLRRFARAIYIRLVVAFYSPTALFNRSKWYEVLDWFYTVTADYPDLTPEQARRFIQLVTDETVLTDNPKTVRFRSSKDVD